MTLAPGHLDAGGNLTSPPPGRVPGSSALPAAASPTPAGSAARCLVTGALGARLLAQRLHQGQDVLAILRAQFVDAGDQQVPSRVAHGVRPAQLVVVVVQPGRFGGG